MARGETARPATVSGADAGISEAPARFALLGTSFAAALTLLLLFVWLARSIAARAAIPFDAGAGEALHGAASPSRWRCRSCCSSASAASISACTS